MSTAVAETIIPPEPRHPSPLHRLAWNWRHNPKRELWGAWGTTVAFYNVFTVAFFVLTRTQPPGHPESTGSKAAQWFNGHTNGVLIGFAMVFLVAGMTTAQNALIAYSLRRMSVSRAFSYTYLVLYSLSAVPGMLLMCIILTVGAIRPDRDPKLMSWLYDFGFLTFIVTMGVFLIGSLVWMLAILLDKNRVFPKWFGYLNLCNALTEVVVAPACIFERGVFAWNGTIAWWIDMVVFGIYTGCFITLLRNMILREDFGTGPLPDLASKKELDPAVSAKAEQ
ncbi:MULTISPECIES: hypothetical protein [Nocardia]|uniref:Uncharacterized protein n=1 Tax=Nocardia vinacea TaxID=96468 RepID=A0ABZ1YLH9_9NOCA|nr:hypothetical protein [Nocardia vinacea]